MEGMESPSLSVREILQHVPLVKCFLRENEVNLSTIFTCISSHTNTVVPGVLFVSLGEEKKYIPAAIQLGAIGILCLREIAEELNAPYPDTIFLYSAQVRKALAQLSGIFFPGVPRFLAGVTGTEGKTSTVNIARQIWGHLGAKAASLGTLGLSTENCPPIPGYEKKDKVPAAVFTTWEQIDFHKVLSALTNIGGVEYLAKEASSQGLIEHRLDGVKFQVGVFTNFTQDHLNYHKTREKYFEAKCYLLQELLAPNAVVIVNNQLFETEAIKTKILDILVEKGLKIWTYGANSGDLYFRCPDNSTKILLSLWGTEYSAKIPEVFRPFPALIENMLAAVGIVIASGFEVQDVLSTLPFIKTVPGRMELVEWENKPPGSKIIIDYAHTAAGFELMIPAVRAMTPSQGKLILVFGCGGNREVEKRSRMGEIAGVSANVIIVTDDNCRFEDPTNIRKMILEGIGVRDRVAVEEIGDRRQALRRALEIMRANDTVLVLGKGCETTIEVQGELIPFVDREVIESILTEMDDK